MKLIVENLSKSYGTVEVLKDLSFELEEGICLGVMGESGSGKSTLGRLVAGIEKATRGKVEIDDRGFNVAMVFQNALGAVNPNMTIFQVLYEALYLSKKLKNPKLAEVECKKVLELVGLDFLSLDQEAKKLSGGQLQRVCIARSILQDPKVIIFDECISGLDPLVQQDILKLLGRLKLELNLTYIFIAHDLSACYYICDQLMVLKSGEKVLYVDDVAHHSFEELKVMVDKVIG